MSRSFHLPGKRVRSVYLFCILTAVAAAGLSDLGGHSKASNDDLAKQKTGSRHLLNFDIRVQNRSKLDEILQFHSNGQNIKELITNAAYEQSVKARTQLDILQRDSPGAEMQMSDLTGSLQVLRSDRPFTKPDASRNADAIAIDFLRSNADLYGLSETDIAGLRFVGESVNEVSGLRMALFDQFVNEVKVFQGELKITLDKEGRVIHSLGDIASNAASNAESLDDLMSPLDVLQGTLKTLGVHVGTEKMKFADRGVENGQIKITVNDGRIYGKVYSKLVYFPVAPGVLVPAWSQTLFDEAGDWYTIADARNGELLWRKNIRSDTSTQQARFRVYVQADGVTPADNPSPMSPSLTTAGSGLQGTAIAPSIVNMLSIQNLTASPNGWIDDCPVGGCTAAQTQTIGNNVHVYMDAVGGVNDDLPDTDVGFAIDGSGKPTGNTDANSRNRDFLGTATRDFQTGFLPPPQNGNPEAGQTATGIGNSGTTAVDQFRRGMLTHMFYLSNWYHDRLFAYGFTPAARNFQQDNFGAGGLGGDRLLLEGQDNSGESNANYSGGDDGIPGRVQMFRYTGPTIDRDSGLDSEVLIHELTHGLSNRLVGNGAGLNWEIGGGLGEGWSDFYGLSLLNNSQADDPNGNYSYGGYTSYKLNGTLTDNYLYGSRRFPYSTNNSVNPLTWADIDDVTNSLSGGIAPSPLNYNANGGMEAHNAGEIWALSLWEVRSRIIADPGGANGNVAVGNNTTLSLVTDAMRLFTPSEPSFIDARNALISADCAANSACPNEASIWGGFADRGLGYNAIAPLNRQLHLVVSRMGVGESFETPNLDVNNVTIDDTVGGNSSGALDPGETVKLNINLKNPWRGASRGIAGATATLTTSTAGVSIVDGSSNYPAIAAQSTSGPTSGDTFSIQLSPSLGCGAAVRLTLSINSMLGVATKQIVLRVGAPSGTGSPIVYTRNPSPDIVIPDQVARGVGDSLTITDDLEIADLNFRVDSVTHPSVGELSIMLRAPNGYGTDLVSLMGCGINIEVCNTGDNITNMVIDQSAAVPNDQLITPDSAAPFTDDFLPVFNSPAWNTPPYGGPDPVGQLSRLNGLSTQGTWSVRVADYISPNSGTLNQWSLIVTPRSFACTSFNPAAPVSVGGRAIELNGRGIKGVFVTLSIEGGPLFTTYSNSFGYFRFPSVPVGATYVLIASNKRYLFDSQQITVSAGISDLQIQGTRHPLVWGN